MSEQTNIETIRHSLSHIMAAAISQLYPGTKLGIGPSIDNGFYYDFDFLEAIKEEDLAKIEKRMREVINLGESFEKSEESREKAFEILEGQPYKQELVKDLPDETASFYKVAGFLDLCKGPHVTNTSELKGVAWKLDKTAGAYWRGDEKNKMMTRIYGLAFETAEELKKYEELLKEAEKRDHKRLGREMDLFSFHPEAPGMPFWHEKGMILWNILEKFGKELRKKYGYIEIKTPILAKNSLWITSGHWDHYQEGMFTFEVGGDIYGVKPMDCPFNIKIYQTRQRSYRDLPIRYTEIGRVFRNEKSGELNGLLRVQEITQDDSHLFVRESQIKDEIKSLLDMVFDFYEKLGLNPEFFLSTRPDDFMGEVETWDKAEQDLKEALAEKNIQYDLKEKDGAFYGPKIDVNIKDALGRSWQVATIQLDFQLPGRFKCEYIDEEGKAQTPVMIHAAVFGSFERMTGILLEHFGGALPIWLSPVQAVVIPISTDKHLDYAREVLEKLSAANVRAQIDERNESMGKKIREKELQKVPYMLVIGDKEVEAGKVAVRKYGEGDKGQEDIAELLNEINQ